MSQQGEGRNVMVQGRIVWTSGKTVFEPKIKLDQNTRQPRIDKNGKQMLEYGFGLAVRKDILAQSGPGQPGEIWAAVHAEAQSMYQGGQIPPSFAMKFKDGDGVDHEGKPFNMREGHAEHVVFAMTTSIAPKFYKWENGNVLISEGIKCGDYVNVQVNIKAHPAFGAGKAGLYLNPNFVQFLGHGKEIINAPSGDQIFGTVAPPLPPGASATPLAPNPGQFIAPPPGQPQMPPQQQWQQPAQAPQQQWQQPPQGPPPPHFGVLPQAHQPPQGGMPMAPAGYPAPAAAATPMGIPTGAPSFAAPAVDQWGRPMGNPMPPVGAAPPAMPGYQQQMAHPGQPAMPPAYPSNGMPPMPPVYQPR